MKDLKYYLKLDYKMDIEVEDGVFFAKFPDLPGCMADGESYVEAAKKVLKVKDEWLTVAFKEGWVIPEPSTVPQVSGRITLRTTRTLHSKLSEKASQEGVSINQLMNNILAEGIGVSKASDKLESKVEEVIKTITALTYRLGTAYLVVDTSKGHPLSSVEQLTNQASGKLPVISSSYDEAQRVYEKSGGIDDVQFNEEFSSGGPQSKH
ncbi:MAG TPA: type II toxin-antitoxin system HicB family antitoxin [Thermodesulfobacteriota bacterium]|nr:type II toxin-antitoxin system HicB family antitoxin [Thermodesulfobacteriota bacterium]HZX35157.1 type II toxin-antitoxin system HicB family antitoxin [Thermodesulfobacteriota bacterium]